MSGIELILWMVAGVTTEGTCGRIHGSAVRCYCLLIVARGKSWRWVCLRLGTVAIAFICARLVHGYKVWVYDSVVDVEEVGGLRDLMGMLGFYVGGVGCVERGGCLCWSV